MNSSSYKILVVGVGNPLLKDEGVGAHVVRRLSCNVYPPFVRILDCGTDLLSLTSSFGDPEKIIIIDAVRTGKKPGHVRKFQYSELQDMKSNMRSAHQLSMIEILKLLKHTYLKNSKCEIILIGIEPKIIELGTELSDEIKLAIPTVMNMIHEEIAFLSACQIAGI